MNCVPPVPGFLEALREQCTKHGAVLIFDEVMTGFRVALGGAQSVYQIEPDLTTIGKVIGGGLPVGAFGGKTEIMEYDRAPGRGLSGWHTSWQPTRGSGGSGDVECDLQARVSRCSWPRALTELLSGLQERADQGRHSVHHDSGWGNVRLFLHRREEHQPVLASDELRRRTFQALFPHHARQWRLPGTFSLRGGLRIQRTRRQGNSTHTRLRPRKPLLRITESNYKSKTDGESTVKFDVYGVGNALVDKEFEVEESFLPGARHMRRA